MVVSKLTGLDRKFDIKWQSQCTCAAYTTGFPFFVPGSVAFFILLESAVALDAEITLPLLFSSTFSPPFRSLNELTAMGRVITSLHFIQLQVHIIIKPALFLVF
jgi:hypothetical protein